MTIIANPIYDSVFKFPSKKSKRLKKYLKKFSKSRRKLSGFSVLQ